MTTAVDNSDAMTATTRETRLLVRYSLASITAAVTTIALKSLAAALTGSVGFLSDAMEAGVNLVAAVVAMLALLLAARPPERLRLCGHQADALGEIGGGLGAAGVVEVAAATAPRASEAWSGWRPCTRRPQSRHRPTATRNRVTTGCRGGRSTWYCSASRSWSIPPRSPGSTPAAARSGPGPAGPPASPGAHDGHDPHRAIRPEVVNRKTWGANRTWRGAATQGRVMSVLRTSPGRWASPRSATSSPTPSSPPPTTSTARWPRS